MSNQSPQQPSQGLNISDSVLETVQIGGIAGRDLNLTQIQGGVGSISVFGTVQVAQASLSAAHPLKREEHQWRQVLLSKVKQFWIDGVLTKSLHTQTLIELGLEERHNYVPKPVAGVDEFSSDSRAVFPEGTSAIEFFENIGAGRTLLILGEPGSGKTVTLLKLAETLINRSENDLSQPLPVLVNLSSWSKKRDSIRTWLIRELYKTYQVSRSLGQAWIDNEQLILLLDGLDEVDARCRDACVRALNQFIQTHGRTEMVVCSRIQDYKVLPEQLCLRSALYVKPLDSKQIDQYLEQAGNQLAALKTVLNQNAHIKQFASSPLILNIMSLAYHGCPLNTFQDVTTDETFHQRLFDAYIQRMFLRRGTTQQYSKEQTLYWLRWLAQTMMQSSQTVFWVERLQPSCLPTYIRKVNYRIISVLTGIFVFTLFFVPIHILLHGLTTGIPNGLGIGLILSLAGIFAGHSGDIETVETLKWSWQNVKSGCLNGLKFGVVVGLILGLLNGIAAGLAHGIIDGLITGLSFGLVILLIGILIGGLISGLRGPAILKKNRPNQGIIKSGRNALLVALVSNLIFGIFFGMIYGSKIGLINGVSYGTFCGLICGGWACFRHFNLRLTLHNQNHILWNYAHFLDYSAERLFLQKVGGGYIFVHRMLLEHFAQMKLEGTGSV